MSVVPSEPLIVRLEPATGPADGESVRRFLSASRLPLLIGLALGIAIGVAVRILATPVYQARALVIPTQAGSMGGIKSLISEFGGVASFAGLSLDEGGAGAAARALLDSQAVAARIVKRHQLLDELFADRWDPAAKRWDVDADEVPTLNDGAKAFIKNHLTLDESRGSSQVAVVVRWRDPTLAARLANDIVREVNGFLRTKAIEDARASLQNLNAELARSNVVGVQQAIGRVAEEQLKIIVLASSREDYALTVLDPAVPPARREVYWPRLIPMTLTGAFGGLIAGLLFALARRFLMPKPPS